MRFFDSTEAGSPVLDGQPGSLKELVKALFVDGYNEWTADTATNETGFGRDEVILYAAAGHNFASGQLVQVDIDGAAPASIGGLKTVTVTSANELRLPFPGSLDYGSGASISGTFTLRRPSLGWSIVQEDTYAIAVKPPIGPTLCIDDAYGEESRAKGFERGVTFAGTYDWAGYGPFPSDYLGHGWGGVYVVKSATADATPRPWFMQSDQHMVHLFIQPDAAGENIRFSFGRFTPFKLDDVHNYLIDCSDASMDIGDHQSFHYDSVGLYLMRSSSGALGAVRGKRVAPSVFHGPRMGNTDMPDWLQIFGTQILISEADDPTADPRGAYTGLFDPNAERPETDGYVFDIFPADRRYVDGGATAGSVCLSLGPSFSAPTSSWEGSGLMNDQYRVYGWAELNVAIRRPFYWNAEYTHLYHPSGGSTVSGSTEHPNQRLMLYWSPTMQLLGTTYSGGVGIGPGSSAYRFGELTPGEYHVVCDPAEGTNERPLVHTTVVTS